ncbi:MAG: PAS domain-containing protein, partial [Smithellaceae bacterium]
MREIEHTSNQYRYLVDFTSDSLYLVDEKCRYVFMNNNHIKRLNSPAEKVIGHFYSEFHSPEQSKKFAKKVQEVYSNNKSAFDELNKINPGVKVLLSSGYNLNGEAGKIINRGCVGFIQKPFTIQD